jgi:methionyl-tRNA formyltransferase
VAFFGTPEFAVPTLARLLASAHSVCGVVTQPDRPRGRGRHVSASPVKALALEHALPVLQPVRLRDAEVTDTLTRWSPDLAVVAAYGKLLPASLLQLPRLGVINVHASLLPRYRGAAPVHRAVIDGETETGVTIMQMVEALDAGPMLVKKSRVIGPDETSDEVEHDLATLGADLLVEVVDALSGGRLAAEPQDEHRATYAPKLTAEEAPIDWTLAARAIHNRVRGLQPWPQAHTFIAGARVKVLKTRVVSGTTSDTPVTVVHVSRDVVHVAAGDGGIVALEMLQADGRRPMTTREFLAGRPIAAGTLLGQPGNR